MRVRVVNDFHQALTLDSGEILPANSTKEVELSEADLKRHVGGSGKHARRRLRVLPETPAPVVEGGSPAGAGVSGSPVAPAGAAGGPASSGTSGSPVSGEKTAAQSVPLPPLNPDKL